MKYPKNQFNDLKKAIPVIVDHFNINKESLLDCSMLHNIHFQIYVNKTYDVCNGNVTLIDGKRLFEKDTFLLYPNGCNDTNIETAVRTAVKELYF